MLMHPPPPMERETCNTSVLFYFGTHTSYIKSPETTVRYTDKLGAKDTAVARSSSLAIETYTPQH
jgi:hypothetical protein